MKKSFFAFLALPALAVAFTNCGQAFSPLSEASGSAGASSSPQLTLDPSIANQPNVMAVTVGCGYVNEPCVSVKICVPGTSTCQTINNVLLDTGSYGLRLFSSTVSLGLTNVTDTSGNNYAECVSYADGSSQWGPIKTADVILGAEMASRVPIQIIDSTFGTVPSGCKKLDTSATATGFNGILGVGLFVEDCGSRCVNQSGNNIYYSCTGSTCSSSAVPIAKQVSNPVGFLTADNNGVIVQTESIADAGAISAAGYLILGINTRSDNQIASATVMAADANGEFTTTFNGQTYSSSFIDSGSNGLYFPASSIVADCSVSGSFAGFFCPTKQVSLTGVQKGAGGTHSVSVGFTVADASNELSNGNPHNAFNNLAGASAGGFDWGMPFFFGRTIAIGIQNRASSLGTGPYWAY